VRSGRHLADWRTWRLKTDASASPCVIRSVSTLELPRVRRICHSMLPATPLTETVHFHRTELGVILSLYGRMVAAGEWRDYGRSSLRDVAIFSVFRRTAEQPMYRIEKRPKMAARRCCMNTRNAL